MILTIKFSVQVCTGTHTEITIQMLVQSEIKQASHDLPINTCMGEEQMLEIISMVANFPICVSNQFIDFLFNVPILLSAGMVQKPSCHAVITMTTSIRPSSSRPSQSVQQTRE